MFLVTGWSDNNEGGYEKGDNWLFRDLDKAKAFVETFESPIPNVPGTLEWEAHGVDAEHPTCWNYDHVTPYVGRGPRNYSRSPIATIELIDFED